MRVVKKKARVENVFVEFCVGCTTPGLDISQMIRQSFAKRRNMWNRFVI